MALWAKFSIWVILEKNLLNKTFFCILQKENTPNATNVYIIGMFYFKVENKISFSIQGIFFPSCSMYIDLTVIMGSNGPKISSVMI